MANGKKGLLGQIRAAGGKVWDEMAPAAGHGASEISAVLYTGSGFVMYPRAGQEPVTMDQLRAQARQMEAERGREGSELAGPEL